MKNIDWDWLYGFTLLLGIFALAFALGLGSVDEAHSYGLHEVLLILMTLATSWAGRKFGKHDDPKPPSS